MLPSVVRNCPVKMADYVTYAVLYFWTPVVGGGLFLLLILILMLLWGILMCKDYWGGNRKKNYKGYKLSYINRVIIKWVYTETKTEPSINENSDKGKFVIVTVHNKEIHHSAVLFMVLHVIFLVGCAVLTLWNITVIEESSECNPKYDCFSVESTKKYQVGRAVQDCSEFGNKTTVLENGVIYYLECYRFVMNYAGGLGAAGGMLYFTTVSTNIYLTSVFLVYRMMHQEKNRRKVICCRYFVAIAIILGVTAFLLALIIFLMAYKPVSSLIFRTFRDGLLFGVYSLAIIICLFTVPFIAFGSLTMQKRENPADNLSTGGNRDGAFFVRTGPPIYRDDLEIQDLEKSDPNRESSFQKVFVHV